jgi:hypothetical protein
MSTLIIGKRAYLKELERIIVDAVSGMDPEDAICAVKVHYSDGSARWLVDVIKQANELRHDIATRSK